MENSQNEHADDGRNVFDACGDEAGRSPSDDFSQRRCDRDRDKRDEDDILSYLPHAEIEKEVTCDFALRFSRTRSVGAN
jgi:hypothetical protein